MNHFLPWGWLCVGLLTILQTPAALGQQTAAPTTDPAQTAPGSPGVAPPATDAASIPNQGQVTPGTVFPGGFAGAINPGPVTVGTAGTPGIGTRADTFAVANVYTGPGFLAVPLTSNTFGPGYGAAELSGPSTFGIATTADMAPGAVAAGEAGTPALSYGIPAAGISPTIVIYGAPSARTAINQGFGTRAINQGFGTRSVNIRFGTQNGINTGFGTRSVNMGFGTFPTGTPSVQIQPGTVIRTPQ
jgi:hypothetical protein